MKKHENHNSGKCPITFALDIFGDKWSLIILRDILFKGKKYYGEFLNSPEKISTNILASRLSKLESEGLISKTQDSKNLSKFIYRLTCKGKDLLPLLLDMIEWSVKYNPQPDTPDNVINGAPRNLLTRLHKDRERLLNEILSKLE
ncbi:HxlR family transcriptional regulator [Thiogranum longum]|uniref:HxlR family transcriptional regulator n=1 Tax=Thiogranum longum TaxID=1537524 RepID=A0A4R1HEQ6_9GAMM|nr:helix-turn-helix domain-containing protein [Thiogranum longum]TCK19133.1 HxlR family transcriptional regulator [Thiogranum longum]